MYAVMILIVLLVAGIFYDYYTNLPLNSTVSTGTPIAMTDPAVVPNGTTNLEISYSSFRIVYKNNTGSATQNIDVTTSGNLNLLSLINSSEVLAEANLPVNVSVILVQFNITSANITINGSIYPVVIPNNKITADIPEAFSRINSSTGLILDFTPTIITVYSSNYTQYILVPSIRAVTDKVIKRTIGDITHLNNTTLRSLDAVRPNITITSAIVTSVGNSTSISVTVKDNSNQSVVLQHVGLRLREGDLVYANNLSYTLNNSEDYLNRSLDKLNNRLNDALNNLREVENNLTTRITSRLDDVNTSLFRLYNLSDSASRENESVRSVVNRINERINETEQKLSVEEAKVTSKFNEVLNVTRERINILKNMAYDKNLNFLVLSNATLFLPFSGTELTNFTPRFNYSINTTNSTSAALNYTGTDVSQEVSNSSFHIPFNLGYTLAPFSSVTLEFNGKIALGNGLITISLAPGTKYLLTLQGTVGARASYIGNVSS